jgi:hypothetical protein
MSAMAKDRTPSNTADEAADTPAPKTLTYRGEAPFFVPLPDGSLAEINTGDPWPAKADASLFILPASLWS